MPPRRPSLSSDDPDIQPLLPSSTMSKSDKTDDIDAVELENLATPDTQVYRVYKRRFLGLGVLILLNIIVSWCWLTYAPVSRYTMEHFGLASESPVNWLSTVVLCAYVISTP